MRCEVELAGFVPKSPGPPLIRLYLTVNAETIRPAEPRDLVRLQAIYAEHVLGACASFEVEPPTLQEMTRRFEQLVAKNFPFLVIAREAEVLGYAYAGPYRDREAYRWTVEDAIYLASDVCGRGLGKRLLKALVDESTRRGFRHMVAAIGDSKNEASIRVHRACGFVDAGTLREVGYKHGRWVDVVFMTRPLGPGATSSPLP